MKKTIIKLIRKIIYIMLIIFKFPKVTVKDNDIRKLKDIEKHYSKKKVEPVVNNIKIIEKNHLTFIVPVYNTEKLLDKCIESLINQKTTYNYNIIFINDGSSDNSLKILEKYAKKYKNIKIITQENKGIAATRNIGIKNITSEYVAFVDSDDFVTPDFIQTLLDNAYNNNADIVRCNYYEYNSSNNKVIRTGKNIDDIVIKNGLKKEITNFKGYPWGGVFKSSLWENIEYPNDYWYEDMIIRMILFRKAKTFSYINKCLYYYCLHENNISKSIEKTSDIRCLDHFFLVYKLLELSEALKIEDKDALYYSVFYEYGVILWLRTRKLEKGLRKEVFNKACEIINKMEYNDNFDKNQRILFNIFKRKDYISWKLYAIYVMLGVKYRGKYEKN